MSMTMIQMIAVSSILFGLSWAGFISAWLASPLVATYKQELSLGLVVSIVSLAVLISIWTGIVPITIID